MKKRLFSIITALALCLTLLPATALAATNVTYYYWDSSAKQLKQATCSSATEVTGSETDTAITWGQDGQDTWYVVNSNVTIGKTDSADTFACITVKGNVHLILADGCNLTIKGNIQVMKDVGTLTIYGQSAGTGELNVENSSSKSSSSYYDAAIGGQRLEKSVSEAGSITIHGGTINATSNGYGAAIGGSGRKISGEYGTATVTIHGGTVTATANSCSAAIGGGDYADDYYGIADVTINGGTINATATSGGAAIGGGRWCTGKVTINGGTINATSDNEGAAIGGGRSSPCNVIISGGKIKAKASEGAAIGSGYGGAYEPSPIEINGGEIYAEASQGAAIGGGKSAGQPVNVTITGGKIEAHGASGAGIGTGYGANSSKASSVTIKNGEIFAEADTGAGIGSGSEAVTVNNYVNVSISGGTVTARTNYVRNTDCGAAIGGGGAYYSKKSSQGYITISGGTVKAYGTDYAPGIGNAPGGTAKGMIKISGGNVTAEGGLQAAGIGSGNYTQAGKIEISGGTVEAKGGEMGAGIGTGAGQTATTYLGEVSIKGGTVNATGGKWAAGIGGGHYVGGSGSITISGGTVTATRGDQSAMTTPAADIGHGGDATSSGINFTLNGTAWTYVNNEGQYTTPTKTAGFYFLGKNGTVYGSQTLPSTYCIASGESLTVPEGASLNTGSYNLYVNGTLSGAERVTGSVYCPLTLTDCTATGTTTYSGTLYGKAGASITLTAPNKTGYIFDSWTTTPSVSISNNTFTMPYSALSVKATYKLAVTITAQPQSQTVTYGGNVQLSVSAQNSSGGTDGITYQWYKDGAALTGETSNTLTLTQPNAGTYQYYCAVTYGGSTVKSNTATVTVNKAAGGVTITGDPGKEYNGQPADLEENGYSVTGDGTVTVKYKVKGADNSTYTETAPKDAGDYTVKVTKAAGTNYAEASATRDFTISRKPVTVSGITASDKDYDGKATATLVYTNAVFTGKLESDTLSVTATGTFEDENVDTGKTVNITDLTLGGASKDNYTLAAEGQQSTTTASISPRPVTVTIQPKSSAYGAAIAELTATDNGIVDGDTDVYALATSATSSSPVGTYDITGEGKSANYVFTFENGTKAYTITAAPQSATVTMEGWTYGDTPNEPVVTGDAEDGAVTYRYKVKDGGYLTEKPTDAGSYTVEATIAATANYQETVVPADFTIAKKELTVTGLTATDRVYAAGNTTVELAGGVLSGIVSGDEEQVAAVMPTTGTITDANAGENKIVTFAEITLTGEKAGNYTLTQPTVTVTISKADPAVGTVTKASPDTIYTSTALGDISLSRASEAIDGTLQLTAGQTLTAGTADYGWTFTPTDSTNYKTVTGTISLTVEADTLSSISASGTPDTTSYKYGEAFKTDGLTVIATYASGNTRDVTAEVTFGALAVGDTSIELSYQGKTCTVSGLTVDKADAPTLADISVWQKYTVTTEQSKDIGRAGMPADAGTLTYAKGTPAKSDPVTIYGWNVDNTGKVTYTLSSELPACRATLPVVITSDNYEDATVNINIELTAKDVPTVSANDITVTYTGFAVPASAITGTASVEGSWSFKNAAPVKVADSSENVTVVFIPTDTDTYETVEDIIKVTINKATPTGTPAYTAITTGDKTLADADLSVGSITPAGGSIVWDLGDSQTVSANTAYNWTYTPAVADQANYNNLTGSIKPYVVSSSGSGGSSTPTYSVTAASTKNGTVSVSPKNASKGDTVTITVKPDKGYELDTLKVLDKNGDRIKVTEKNGVYIFTMPASKVTIETVFTEIEQTTENPFKDVSASAYYYDAVIWAAENGITRGTSATTFSPNAPCTRAQIVTFLWRAAGSPVVNYAMNFSDVPADAYYAEAVRWAVSQGITTGTGDGTFSPNATCTRAQAMTFIYRSEQAQGGGMQGAWMFQNPFFDVDLENYYGEAVMWAVANGITNGTSDTTFSPGADCTRAQIVTFLFRCLGK
ncbi:S-layer homology domain-containing protein [Eubacteriales bacterium SGI.150]